MTTLNELLGDVNDLLDDVANTKVSEAQKIRYINRGQHAMWPKIYQIVQDSTLLLVADQYEYVVPATFDEGIILGVEIETEGSSSDFYQADGLVFDLVPEAGFGNKIRLKNWTQLPSEAGSSIRITGACPLTALATGTDVYTGPSFSDELPVLYAMAMATARDYEDRTDYTRYSTTLAQNGVLLEDLTRTGNWWMRQFQIMLDQVQMPHPSL